MQVKNTPANSVKTYPKKRFNKSATPYPANRQNFIKKFSSNLDKLFPNSLASPQGDSGSKLPSEPEKTVSLKVDQDSPVDQGSTEREKVRKRFVLHKNLTESSPVLDKAETEIEEKSLKNKKLGDEKLLLDSPVASTSQQAPVNVETKTDLVPEQPANGTPVPANAPTSNKNLTLNSRNKKSGRQTNTRNKEDMGTALMSKKLENILSKSKKLTLAKSRLRQQSEIAKKTVMPRNLTKKKIIVIL